MSRQTMLTLLRSHPGEFVSGEMVSERLGLSRAAIWKAVDTLRKAGYVIEARTGQGYRLVSAPDVLTEEEITMLSIRRGTLTDEERQSLAAQCAEADRL